MSIQAYTGNNDRIVEQSDKIGQSSPATSDGIPAAYNSIPTYPLVPVPPPSPGPQSSPRRRNGSIIKNHRRTPSFVKAASSYKLRERSGPSQGKWVFIVNGTKIKQWHELCPKLLKQLSSVEWKVHITQYPGHARKLAEKACLKNADLIAAVGGDGTLNEIVDGVMKAGVYGDDGLPRATITVLPIGTASDFHRSMAWEPNNFEDAMWRIGKRGSTAVLDVARVQCASPYGPQDRYFINVASCGASAKAALGLDKWRWMGEKNSYRMAALSGLFSYVPRTLAIRIDDGEWQHFKGTTMVAIGNGSYFGNGLNIAPDANPYDGRLQVVTAQRMGVMDFLFKSWKLKMGKHLDLNGFESQNASKIDVAIWGKSTDMNAYTVPSLSEMNNNTNTISGMQGYGQQSTRGDDDDGSAEMSPTPRQYSSSSMAERESSGDDLGTPGGRSSNGGSRPPSEGGSSSMSRSATQAQQYQQQMYVQQQYIKNAAKKKPKRKEKIDYGPVPIEIDGEVIGHAPFTVMVIPGAIKFRVAGVNNNNQKM